MNPSRGAVDRAQGSGKSAPRAGSSPTPTARERSATAQTEGHKRLARKVESDPKTGREILERGKFASGATDVATRTAVGFGAGVATGTTSCFWDPYYSNCAPYWNWWCSPGWSWWWSTCASPWWGWGWGFGYWSGSWGLWWSGCYPYYSYPYYSYPYYSPYPAYYSTVIYDTYEPAPVEGATVEEYAPVEPGVSEGEGMIQVAGDDRPGARSRLGEVNQILALGDQAFREGRYSEAVHYYAKAVELEPNRGVLHLILSDALFATGDYHYAAYSLRRALELDPTVVEEIGDKHLFYADPTEFDRQLQLLERYLGDHFLDDDARLLLAANYLFGGKPAQSADLLMSPFSVAIRESGGGKLLLDRALALRRAGEQAPTPR